jgi:Predicted permease
MDFKNLASFFVLFIGVVALLIYSQSLLIPFIFAILLWFIIRKLKLTLNRISFIKQRIPSWAKSFLSAAFVLIILNFISKILLSNINNLAKSYDQYESNIHLIILKLNKLLNLNLLELLKDYSTGFDFGVILSAVFSSVTDILSNSFMILLYALFIFLEESFFLEKLNTMIPTKNKYSKAIKIIDKIETAISHYLGLKTLVSLITAI